MSIYSIQTDYEIKEAYEAQLCNKNKDTLKANDMLLRGVIMFVSAVAIGVGIYVIIKNANKQSE